MRKVAFRMVAVLLAAAVGTAAFASPQGQAASGDRQAISYDKWLSAKDKAERYDQEGKYVEALQYYLEYTRQAAGLGRPGLVAWGKNNAAYMIIKMHREDPTVDLAPAEKMLEEGLAIPEVTEECRKVLTMNLEHVKLCLGRTE
jgi:hypothetical protein